MTEGRVSERAATEAVTPDEPQGPGEERLNRRELLQRIRIEIATHGLTPDQETRAIRLAETMVNGPRMSRRALMRATAAGWAAVAVGALTQPVRAAKGIAGVADLWLPV